jgi:hypothetical protein
VAVGIGQAAFSLGGDQRLDAQSVPLGNPGVDRELRLDDGADASADRRVLVLLGGTVGCVLQKSMI